MINTDFHKIRRLPPYVFEQVNRTKAALRAKGADIIDLGMGNPDLPTPKHIVDKLVETARKPDVNGYSASRGIPGLRRALTDYYKRRFDVKLDKDREVIVTLGSKEGFANLAQAISAPGDVILAPDPSYPLHHFGFIIAGASIRGVPAHTPEQYLSNLGRAVRYSVPPPTAMVLCFPSNPTAAVCDLDFYKEAVKFAKKHDLWILSDLAYNEIYFDEPTPSILQVDGAKDIAVEFTTPIQVAAVAALDGPQDCVDDIRRIYRTRRDALVDSFTRAGWPVPSPKASMFAWAPIPEKLRHLGSLEFSIQLINEAHVAVAPGAGFGEHGDDYVRIALVENEQRIRQAGRNIRKFLAAHGVKEIKPVAAE